jgi:hypothetical protein
LDDFGIGAAVNFLIGLAASGWGIVVILAVLILTGVL